MRGSPLRELAVCLALAGCLLVPLTGLVRSRQGPPEVESADPAASAEVEAWIEVRVSHPPVSVDVSQGGTTLWSGKGRLRQDAYVNLATGPGAGRLTLRVVWPADVEQPYGELTVEPEGFRAWTAGFWGGAGPVERAWTPEWEEAR